MDSNFGNRKTGIISASSFIVCVWCICMCIEEKEKGRKRNWNFSILGILVASGFMHLPANIESNQKMDKHGGKKGMDFSDTRHLWKFAVVEVFLEYILLFLTNNLPYFPLNFT